MNNDAATFTIHTIDTPEAGLRRADEARFRASQARKLAKLREKRSR